MNHYRARITLNAPTGTVELLSPRMRASEASMTAAAFHLGGCIINCTAINVFREADTRPTTADLLVRAQHLFTKYPGRALTPHMVRGLFSDKGWEHFSNG